MKTSIRHCMLCGKKTKHSIVEEEINSILKKEVRTCTLCKIILARVMSNEDKITLACYKCKDKTWHFKEKWHYQCTICGNFSKIRF